MHTITKKIKWSPDGLRVQTVEPGEYATLPARFLEIAAMYGAIETKPAKKPASKGKKANDPEPGRD
ncbi:TPA: hypothetical protein OMU21_004999 [Klebsiella aerogenes]|nr:hypothetical protein [Klebsiella aerogenes]